MNFTKSRITFWSCTLGNGLELYDFTLFGVFTPLIATKFFTPADNSSAFFSSLTALSIGYFGRHIGAIVCGYIGDKYGRKRSLILTMLMMSVATGGIGLCPTYDSIGIPASIILFLARFIQGLCAGGEPTGAAIFLIENTHKALSSFNSTAIFISGCIGCLVALFLGNIFLTTGYNEGWRIPFIIGLIFAICLLCSRLKVEENKELIENFSNKNLITNFPIIDIILNYRLGLVRAISCGALSGTMSSTIIVFVNLFLYKIVGIKLQYSLTYSTVGLIAFLVASLFYTKISSIGSLGLMLTIYLYSYILNTKVNLLIIIAQLILGLFSGCFVCLINSYLSDQFPLNIRFTRVSFGYNLGYAVCGGLFPIVSFKLIDITGNIFSPAIYVMIIAIFSTIAVGRNYSKWHIFNIAR